ncbi:MAG: hypothetical protein AAF557_15350 [Pseudomonadota bacterium]
MYKEDSRYSRGQKLVETLSSTAKARHDKAINRLLVEWAKEYGDRLDPVITDYLSVEAATHMDIIEAAHADSWGPSSNDDWRQVAKEIAEANPMVTRCLEFADATKREGFRREVLTSLPGTTKMNMQREGTLDSFVKDRVAEMMDDHIANRTA